ncbi:MAG: hypothetical protein U1E66_04370 [Rhodospirillales bacterium]
MNPHRLMMPTLIAGFFSLAPLVKGDTRLDINTLFDAAEKEGRTGLARKSAVVEVRPAKPGEVIVTIIAGEGKETQSRPAVAGDRVVRNRCSDTGNEQYLVSAKVFTERYEEAPTDRGGADGWQPYRSVGPEMLYMRVRGEDGSFTFTAPWGEAMVARPGDVIVRDPGNPKDTYRVAALSFDCTYEIIRPGDPR